MNWDAIAAIGQVLGSIAVFITIVYLSIQTRHARHEAQRAREQATRSARQARCDAGRDYWMAVAIHPELAGAFETLSIGTGNPPTPFAAQALTMGLTPIAARQLDALCWAGWQNFEASVENLRLLEAGVREGLNRRMVYNYRSGGPFGKWYETTKEMLNPDTVRYIDNLLARSA